MRRLCCCGRDTSVRPTLARAPDLVADLPPLKRDSSAETTTEDDAEQQKPVAEIGEDATVVDGLTEVEIKSDEKETVSVSRTPSIHIEDLSEKSNQSLRSVETDVENISVQSDITPEKVSETSENVLPTTDDGLQASVGYDLPQDSNISTSFEEIVNKLPSEKSSPASNHSKSAKSISSKSENVSPEPPIESIESRSERDVRTALAECMIPSRHEDWEVIVNRLIETDRLAKDKGARAPAASWRAATRAVAVHVRSLRSRVARTACCTLGTLFEHRGRALDPELEEAIGTLLDRCADVNRFLRADATAALGRVACGGGCARVGVALARRGATHRAGPVRAAAAQALARLVRQHGAMRILDLPSEPRTVILRASGELLGDASPEARLHARHLCLSLSEDVRFRQMLKEAMPPSRYRAIEKFVDKLRCR